MRRIVQKDSTGCGLACAAMLSGNSYAFVKATAIKLKLVDPDGPYYTNSSELNKLLSKLGVRSEKGRRLSNWAKLTSCGVVGINYKPVDEVWHWVVYVPTKDGGYVLDPRENIRSRKRRDFGRMSPRNVVSIKPS